MTRLFESTNRAAVLLTLSLTTLTGRVDSPTEPVRRVFFKDSRAELALARVRGDSTVSIVIAARPRGASTVARAITRLGGSIRYRADDVDYLRVRLPTDSAERVFDIAEVQTADIDVAGAWSRPFLQSADPDETDFAAVRSTTATGDDPISRPYSPLADLDAAAFRAEHPSYDGRGVTIAVLDGHPDLLLPEFHQARRLDGTPTRKVIRYIDVSDPAEPDDVTPHWIAMQPATAASDSLVTARGTYRTPRAGQFRFGVLDEERFTGNGLDLNRDGNPAGASRVFGVLWHPGSGEVWVDTDQDFDFSDETALRDYAVAGELRTIGRDKPDTPVRESVAFGVQIDAERGYVVINPGIYGHGTMVSGAAVANKATGGRVDGVAPQAQLAAIKYAHRTSGLIEGLIYAYRDPDIDLVVLQQNVVIAIPYLLQDGRFTASIIAERLVARYGKALFVPASNVPGMSTTSEHGVSDAAISVGAYQSAENYLINSGIVTAARDNLHSVGSYGPGGNGAMQPDLLAPAAVPTVNPGIETPSHRLGLYALDAGYGLCSGTSCATPVAAGAAALLLSAAKQNGLTVTAEMLREALYATTRTLAGIPIYQQGRGLLQVGAAWEALQQLVRDGPAPVIVSSGSVRTRLSDWLEQPGAGAGIYEREGWRAGQRAERSATLTRMTGPREPIAYEVDWTSHDSTFSSPARVELPLRRPTTLPVSIAPKHTGAHSATLTLRNPAYPGRRQQMMAVAVAAHRLEAANGYSATDTLRIPRPGRGSMFIEVPEGTRALRVGLDATGIVQLGLRRPDGRQELGSEPKASGAQSRVVPDPMPGVWEAVVTAVHEVGTYAPDYPRPLTPISAVLRAAVYRVDVTGEGLAASGSVGIGHLTAVNRGAPFSGAAVTTSLGSARHLERNIATWEQHRYDIDVPGGTAELFIAAEGGSEDDLDLYLFDCTRQSPAPCVPAGAATHPARGDRLSYRTPAAGRWAVVVDAARLSGPRSRYRYLDVVMNPALGATAAADADTVRPAGANWRVPVSAWLAADPAGGRTPVVVLQVTSDSALTHHQRTTSLELIGPKVNAILGRTIIDLRQGTVLLPERSTQN